MIGHKIIAACCFIASLLASGFAHAQADRGTYRCSNCETQGIPNEEMAGNAQAFLFSTVNSRLNINAYRNGDTLTFCNGSFCMKYVWRAFTGWRLESATEDKNRAESPDTLQRSRTSGPPEILQGNNCYAPRISGHYEWWDYYSGNTYVGSSDRYFVVTNTIPGSMMNCT